ncbi:MAG: prephenate dehydrogenase/arogenate dehydrogenase family protein [Isosphaeraceae bacterium]|nr:prephenate dehydrogenase/arogenate dehydrogenase family protein [Isosphaeraceae bacterium]
MLRIADLGERGAPLDRVGTVAIIGVGLIGGSVGLALRERGLADEVIGIGRDEAKLSEAVRLGAIDSVSTDAARGVARADVVVVCTPVTRIALDVRQAASQAPENVLVTDAGSTKQGIVEEVERDERARQTFVAAHPIAGSERHGVAHGRADLFEGRACVLTPTSHTPPDRLGRARGFWAGLGCRMIEMEAAAHDEALALTSHLPHAVAAALAASVPPEVLALTAGAYRDITRVAGADATVWTAIFRANRGPILQALATFQSRLAAFQDALSDDDEQALHQWWEAARAQRREYEALQARPRHL